MTTFQPADLDLSLSDLLGCYDLSDQHKATLELASRCDSRDSLEQHEPMLQDALRALRNEANAEADFNRRHRLNS